MQGAADRFIVWNNCVGRIRPRLGREVGCLVGFQARNCSKAGQKSQVAGQISKSRLGSVFVEGTERSSSGRHVLQSLAISGVAKHERVRRGSTATEQTRQNIANAEMIIFPLFLFFKEGKHYAESLGL